MIAAVLPFTIAAVLPFTIAAVLPFTIAVVQPFMSFNMHWQDPEGFVEDGGWSFLDQEGGSDAEGEEDESEGDGARALVGICQCSPPSGMS